MDLSVIIVNFNVRYYLEQCLYSVIRAAENIDCEIIVIDNNSSDDSCLMVNSLFPSVRLIRNISNEGFAKACNQGLKAAEGEFILMLNPDTIVGEETFSKCISFMQSHPDAGAMGVKMADGCGRYLRESKRSIPYPAAAFYKMTGLTRLFSRSPVFSRYYMEHLDADNTSQIEVLPGAFMFLRKSTLDTVGLFDEDYFMYGEDIDLSCRILKAGLKIYYYPEVTIIHYKGKSSGKNPVKSVVSFYRAMLIFTKKYFSGSMPLLYYLFLRISVYSASGAGILLKLTRHFFTHIFSAGTNSEKSYLKDLYKVKSPVLIAANRESFKTITEKIKKADIKITVAGRTGMLEDEPDNEIKGDIGNLNEIIRSVKAKSVIFSVKSLGLTAVINTADSITETQTCKCIVPD